MKGTEPGHFYVSYVICYAEEQAQDHCIAAEQRVVTTKYNGAVISLHPSPSHKNQTLLFLGFLFHRPQTRLPRYVPKSKSIQATIYNGVVERKRPFCCGTCRTAVYGCGWGWEVSEGRRRVGMSRKRLGRYNELLGFSTCWAYLDKLRLFYLSAALGDILGRFTCRPRVFCVFSAPLKQHSNKRCHISKSLCTPFLVMLFLLFLYYLLQGPSTDAGPILTIEDRSLTASGK